MPATAATFDSVSGGDLCGFADESAVVRSPTRQDYLVCAVLLAEQDLDETRDALRPLLRPGQLKFHWSAEGPASRRRMVETLACLQPMSIVVTHRSQPQHKTERFRRKCLEVLYYELTEAGVKHLILEGRTPSQDRRDMAHVVALQNQHLSRDLRIAHRRGGDEPLLWIPDVVLGAINSAHQGEHRHLDALRHTIVLHTFTSESLQTGERP